VLRTRDEASRSVALARAADVNYTKAVTGRNSRGGSGTAGGTTSWAVSGIVLMSGSNGLTITARDAAGNTSSDTVTVTSTQNFRFTDDP
jgi:hypothetical protein